MTRITADQILQANPVGRITRAMVPNGISWREGIKLYRADLERAQQQAKSTK